MSNQAGADARMGAEALMATLADAGVDACFANPGTSEMQAVAALDRVGAIKPVLCLFEGVATGAADGYARIAGKPAMTLLHLGSGLGNGVANLHNARRARSPIVNLVGDHATYHLQYDAPLTSDIASIAKAVSVWQASAATADDACRLAAEAWAAAQGPISGPASVILPADSAWTSTSYRAQAPEVTPRPAIASSTISAIAKSLKAATKPVLLCGGPVSDRVLGPLSRLQGAGIRVMTDTFLSRQARGAGRFAPGRMQYFGEMALADLDGVDLMVLCGTQPPAAFFAYPERPSLLVPPGARVESLATAAEAWEDALAALAEEIGGPAAQPLPLKIADGMPTGEITVGGVAQSIARHLPEGAIICDDAVTSGMPVFLATATAKPHDWLMLTGGAIGAAMPLAVGAATAAPDRTVLALSGDGAGAYTLQALWTMAREGQKIVTVIFANRVYKILQVEAMRTGSGNLGSASRPLLDLGDPAMDWASLARGFGVNAVRCDSADGFDKAFAAALQADGPTLIEAIVTG